MFNTCEFNAVNIHEISIKCTEDSFHIFLNIDIVVPYLIPVLSEQTLTKTEDSDREYQPALHCKKCSKIFFSEQCMLKMFTDLLYQICDTIGQNAWNGDVV